MKTALTIGYFDGVHLGHLALLKNFRKWPHTTILTFSNHPKSILNPPAPKEIIPLDEKIERLKPFADNLIVRPFTKEFANLSYSTLLDEFDLSAIILGKGSVFGKDREGTEENIRAYAKEKGIEVEYIPKVIIDGAPVSSSRIREALKLNNKKLAEKLIGRKL